MNSRRTRLRATVVVLLLALMAAPLIGVLVAPAEAAPRVPNGFRTATVARGLSMPVDMDFAPDGRLFIAEQGGRVRVLRRDGRLVTFMRLSRVANGAARGLSAVAVDPDFATNHFLYLNYTVKATRARGPHNRVIRVTADGNKAAPRSARLLIRLDQQRLPNHLAGAMDVGADGMLYIATGDNERRRTAQRLNSLNGKLLRITRGGGIPTSNPFYSSVNGRYRTIWARGLRNPFKFDFRGDSDTLFINDVGEDSWEEINAGQAGAHYGWPRVEGPESRPRFTPPVYSYRTQRQRVSNTRGCAITGGTFYDPTTASFPGSYAGDYFYADLCSGWIRRYDVAADSSRRFATRFPAHQLVELDTSPSGSLYALRLSGKVTRISYSG